MIIGATWLFLLFGVYVRATDFGKLLFVFVTASWIRCSVQKARRNYIGMSGYYPRGYTRDPSGVTVDSPTQRNN